jgi:hypothetical protein
MEAMKAPVNSRSLPRTAAGIALTTVVALGMARGSPEATAPPLRVGYADVDITPPLGTSMPGYFRDRKATEVLDPLLVKALVVRQGGTTVALVAVDTISLSAPVVKAVRDSVEEKTEIPAEHVFLHATHTHTGAVLSSFKDHLPGQVADAIQKALDRSVVEKSVQLGRAREAGVAFIRRYLMQDGSIRTNPGRANPAIVRPVGETDSRVHVVSFGDAKTLLVSFGLHLDCVSGTGFSADYPFHLTEAVRAELGRDWNVLYLNACCGNVNHVNVRDRDQRSSYAESRRIGRALARAALRAHGSGREIRIDRLAAGSKTVACPVRRVPQEVREWARAQMEENPTEASRRRFNEATPSRILALAEREGESDPAEVIAVILGPIGIVGFPAEVFVEVARDLQRHSLLEPTLVIGLTGGSMGYLPHPRGYDEGGYEATFASARYDPRTSLLWSDAATAILNQLLEEKTESPR